MSKKTVLIIVCTTVFTIGLVAVLPVSKAVALNGAMIDRMQEKASNSATKSANELSRIQTRAATMIQVRLTTLQNLQTRIQNDKRLSDDEKSAFEADITTTISNLTALKAKIDADTDATVALADAKSIVTSYRIYMVFEPKMRLTVIIDNLQTTSASVATLVTKVQTLLTNLKNQGKDTTNAQNALNDISTQLTSINTLLTTDKTLVSNVQVGTADPASIFIQVRKDLATVRSDVAKIRSDFATIKTSLKSAGITPTSASSSAQ